MNDKDIIEKFEKDYEAMQTYWGTLHRDHQADTKFVWFNDQWDGSALQERKKTRDNNGSSIPPRPTNVFNILKPFIIKVINGIKKMKPTIKVIPVDSGTDKKLAEVRRGIHRAIERNTGAVAARLGAVKDAVSSGYGFYRFVTDYTDPKSFDQELCYKPIEDATTVLFDDLSKEISGSDCKKVILQERMSKEEFKKEFGMDWEDVYQGQGVEVSGAWGSYEYPTISEYWFAKEKKETLVRITDENGGAEELFLSEAKKRYENEEMEVEAYLDTDEDGEIIKRPTMSRQVWWVKLAGKQVVDKTLWKGSWIPVFKIEGRKSVVKGEVKFTGLSRDAKGSQKTYNYARNNQLERMGLATKAPYMTPVGGIPPHEQYKWASANTRNWDSLGYNAYDEQGRPLPPPARTGTVQIDPGLTQEAIHSAEEIKSTIGLFGDYIGDPGGQRSGKAILAGAQESADIVYDFAYNMSETMSHEGKVREELIPKIYDTPRQVRMVGEDDAEKVVLVNQQYQDESGKDQYYDMKVGKFDIAVTMGPSDETKRMETRESMEIFMKTMPLVAPLIADLYAKEQDWRYSDEVASRVNRWIKKTNPDIIADENDENPELSAARKQMQTMQQQAMAVIQQLKGQIQQIQQDKSIEIAKVQNDDKANEEKNEIDIFEAETQAEIDKYNAETGRMKVVGDNRKNIGQEKLGVAKFKSDMMSISKPERRYT